MPEFITDVSFVATINTNKQTVVIKARTFTSFIRKLGEHELTANMTLGAVPTENATE